ncbi:MAG: flagellar basal body-associated FliL family protein [Dyella sp.]
MANAEKIPVESLPVPAKKGANRLPVILLGLILLILLGLCGYMMVTLHALQSKVGPNAPTGSTTGPSKVVDLYQQLEPAFVVNFQDDDATRYLQVGVTVMAHDPAVIQAIKDNDPVIRNALVMLFSAQSFAQLSDTAGKQKLQADALAAVRKIVAQRIGKSSVDALYFTSFVMQ